MRPVRAILFDVGDTLVFDSPPLRKRAWKTSRAAGLPFGVTDWARIYAAAERHGLAASLEGREWDEEETLRAIMNQTLRGAHFMPLTDKRFDRWAAALAASPFRRRAHRNAAGLLTELRRRGFLLGAVSDWETTLPEVLAGVKLLPLFDAVSASAMVGARKPDPRLFHHALEQLGVQPEDALHVGDWYELDVRGARAAGVQAVLFDHAGRAPDADCPRVETFPALAELLLALPYANDT